MLDVNCKAHDVDNLYVVDTSFFPSIGAVNPALTAMANAMPRRRAPGGPPVLANPADRAARRRAPRHIAPISDRQTTYTGTLAVNLGAM